jgi:hypothetical protein
MSLYLCVPACVDVYACTYVRIAYRLRKDCSGGILVHVCMYIIYMYIRTHTYIYIFALVAVICVLQSFACCSHLRVAVICLLQSFACCSHLRVCLNDLR